MIRSPISFALLAGCALAIVIALIIAYVDLRRNLAERGCDHVAGNGIVLSECIR